MTKPGFNFFLINQCLYVYWQIFAFVVSSLP